MTKREYGQSTKRLPGKILTFVASIWDRIVLHVGPSSGRHVERRAARLTLPCLVLYFTIGICYLHAQSALTQIYDVLVNPDSSHPNGTLTLSWQRGLNDANPRQEIPAGSTTIPIVNGVISVSLFPTTVELPPATCYTARYAFTGPTPRNQISYWSIPVSATPVNLQQIQGQTPCSTQQTAQVAPGQIVPGSPGITQVLTSDPNGFVHWAVGGGGGGNPAGTNGQLQYNNLGAFGGFTVSGDCSLSRPNFICTKTNGVNFAPSATTDTTNASNISSGLLGIARGSTGTSTVFTAGNVVFAGAGGAYSQDGTFTFEPTQKRLAIGSLSGFIGSTSRVEVFNGDIQIDSDTHDLQWVSTTDNTRTGFVVSDYNGGANRIRFGLNGSTFFTINNNGFTSVVGGVAICTTANGGYQFDVQCSNTNGTARFFDQSITGATKVEIDAGVAQASAPLVAIKNSGGTIVSQFGGDGNYTNFSGGIPYLSLAGGSMLLGNSQAVAFNSTPDLTSVSLDACLERNTIGVLEIDNCTPGTYRDLVARNVTVTSGSGTGTACAQLSAGGQITRASAACGGSVSGTPPYSTQTITSSPMSILAATHGQGQFAFGVCWSAATNPQIEQSCNWSRNPSTGDLALTYTTAPAQIDIFGATGGFSNPMTTEGDLIYRSSGVPARLGIGSANTCLLSNGTDPGWSGTCARLTGSPTTNQVAIFASATTITGTATDATTTHALFATAGAPAFRAFAAGDIPATLGGTAFTGAVTENLGQKFTCTHGSNATCGVSTLSSGTVTVSTTAIAALAAAGGAGDAVRLTLESCSACGSLSVGTVSAGTSFVINSTSGTDASLVFWSIERMN